MKKLNLLVAVLVATLLLPSVAFASAKKKANKEMFQWRYEIEPAVGQAKQGTAMVKIWTYSKKAKVAVAQASKNAVHAIIFKGYAPSTNGTRIQGQKPLITDFNAETEHAAYFKEFFEDGGKYQKFVSLVNNGVPGPNDIMKVGKEYKIGIVVVVSKDALRKELESAGIVRGLNSGF